MGVEKRNREELRLLPMPLSPRQSRLRAQELKEFLKNHSSEELIELELDSIYWWSNIKDPVTKHLCRNYTLVYSKGELKTLVIHSLREILDADIMVHTLDELD